MLKMTQWTMQMAYPGRDVQVHAQDDCIQASFYDRRYSVVKLLREVEGVRSGYYYRVSFQSSSANVNGYMYYICRDAKGKELSKGYLHNGDRFVSPANAAQLAVEVLLTAKGTGSFQLTDLELTEEEAYQPRNVKICTIGYELLNRELVTVPFEENVALTLREIDEVAHLNPDVIVLTENAFQTSEQIGRSGKSTANRLDDPHVQALCAKAKEYNCYIVTSLKTLDEDDVLHNTSILIDRNGKIQGTSHKTHLTIGEKEGGMELGTEFPVFETDFGKVGMLVCWEHFFPEAVRILTLKGAELILVPTHGFRLDRAATRALENGVYFVTAHVRGSDSVILDPDGQVIADGTEKGYAFAQIDLNKKAAVPYLSCSSWADPHNIYLNERRPSLYGVLSGMDNTI